MPRISEDIEDAIDKNTKLILQIKDKVDRCIQFPETDPSTSISDIDSSIDRAGKYLTFDSTTGAPATSSTVAAGSVTISTFAETLLDDTTALLAMATLQGIPVINVMNATYGATGDGSTDDTTAIQAAVDAAELLGAIVFFPDPTVRYKISDEIDIDSANVKVLGSGMGCAIRQTTWGQPVFEVRADDVWISNLFLECTEARTAITNATHDSLANGLRAYCAGVYLANAERTRLTNLKISGFVAGIRPRGETDNSTLNEGLIINNVWIDTVDWGIIPRQQRGMIVNNVQISDVTLSQTGDPAHALYFVGQTTVLNTDCIVSNITAWDTTGAGTSCAFQVKYSDNCTFSNLTANVAPGLLIVADEVSDCTFTNLTGIGMTDTGGTVAIVHLAGATNRRNRISGVNIDNSTAGNVSINILNASGTNDDNIIENVLITDSCASDATAHVNLRGTRNIVRNIRINNTDIARKGIVIGRGSGTRTSDGCMVDGISSTNAAGSYFFTVYNDATNTKIYYDRNRIDLQSGTLITNADASAVFRDKVAGIMDLAISSGNASVYYENELVTTERKTGNLN
jgi:hypothetical protein